MVRRFVAALLLAFLLFSATRASVSGRITVSGRWTLRPVMSRTRTLAACVRDSVRQVDAIACPAPALLLALFLPRPVLGDGGTSRFRGRVAGPSVALCWPSRWPGIPAPDAGQIRLPASIAGNDCRYLGPTSSELLGEVRPKFLIYPMFSANTGQSRARVVPRLCSFRATKPPRKFPSSGERPRIGGTEFPAWGEVVGLNQSG